LAPDMPLNALAAADVDYRASLAEIPALLEKLVGEPAARSHPAPADIVLEVQIALGRQVGSDVIRTLGSPAPFSCPGCGGVLSQMHQQPPLRFRCQVGHAYSAQTLLDQKEGSVDEALRLALRVLEERTQLTQRMSDDAHKSGRSAAAHAYAQSAIHSQDSAKVLRDAMAKGIQFGN
jgi:two-component system chemotaxis response regulator CheB